MLACIRQGCRRPPPVRPSVASFSTSPRSRVPKPNEAMDTMVEMLRDEDARQPAEVVRKGPVWEKMYSNKILGPRDLTYKGRSKPNSYSRRFEVAPSPHVARSKDVFHRLGLDPRSFTMNATLLYEFVSGMGKIYGRDTTNLTAKSQRLLGKTIRRAKQMGIMAVLSKPPPKHKY